MSRVLIRIEYDDGSVPPISAPCDEIGRVSRAYVSAHDRTRVHAIHVAPGERRCVVADYNGALPAGRSIASIEWRLAAGGVAGITAAGIPTSRQAQAQLWAGAPGCVALRCAAKLDNGEVYVQRFMVQVSASPVVGDEARPSGALVLTAVAA